jgi:hypothetical protein
MILTGALVMILLRSRLLAGLGKPIDGGALFADGRPFFGEAKTWRGLLFYIAGGAACGGLWYGLCRLIPAVYMRNLFFTGVYVRHLEGEGFIGVIDITDLVVSPGFGITIGLLLGFTYAVFELPNSFLKRRFRVEASGSAAKPLPRAVFFLLDQTDSVLGCLLLLKLFYPGLNLPQFLVFLLLGACTHILVNLILFSLKVRKRAV